jgi:hypothetical protein
MKTFAIFLLFLNCSVFAQDIPCYKTFFENRLISFVPQMDQSTTTILLNKRSNFIATQNFEIDLSFVKKIEHVGKVFDHKKYVSEYADDVKLFLEWKVRFTMNFAACRGVFAQTFQNNWINGVLYMFSFNKSTQYSLSQPDEPIYKYCKANGLKYSMKQIASTIGISSVSIQRYIKKC